MNGEVTMKIYRLRIEMLVEQEYENIWYEFYHTNEELKKGRFEIESEHKRPDESWKPNIDYMEFEEEEISLEQAKKDMTVSEFEEFFGITITI